MGKLSIASKVAMHSANQAASAATAISDQPNFFPFGEVACESGRAGERSLRPEIIGAA